MLMLVAGLSATETRDHEELADRCRHTDASPPSAAAAECVRSPYGTTPRMTRVHPYHDKRTIKYTFRFLLKRLSDEKSQPN